VTRLILVVPCFNEAARLPVDAFSAFLAAGTADIVFVDDGSTDGTGDVLRRLVAAHPARASVLTNARNAGKGESVRRGIVEAFSRSPEVVGYWDADLSTPLDAVVDLLGVLDARPECQMVFGARVQLLGREIVRHAYRHYLGRVFATAASLLLRLPIYDTQCGAKLFRVTPQTLGIFAEPFGSRWIFDVELIARFVLAAGSPARAGAQIVEFPLRVWRDVAGSKIRPRHAFVTVIDLAKIYRRYR
jgi:glycosyltransferase involved in cell wall biosynthesis